MYRKDSILFASDLDRTLIHSYKVADVGEVCVERMGEKELSYMSPYAYENLRQISEACTFVPITTRSVEQYRRLALSEKRPTYAVTTNGGVLLIDGMVDEMWLNESKELIHPATAALDEGRSLLAADEHVNFDIRMVDELFLFTKSADSEATVERLKSRLDASLVQAFTHGEKVYIIPNVLNKGTALLRLRQRLQPKYVISAGDSVFDLPMLEKADLRFAADDELGAFLPEEGTRVFIKDQKYFADMITKEILLFIQRSNANI